MKKVALMGLLGLLPCSLLAATPAGSPAQKLSEGLEKAQQRRLSGTGIPVNLSPETMNGLMGRSVSNQNSLETRTTAPSAVQTPKVSNPSSRKSADRANYYDMNLYGYCSYEFVTDFAPGMFEFVPDGYEFKWADTVYIDYHEDQAMMGWVKDGIYYVLHAGFIPGQVYSYYYAEVDFESGEILGYQDLYGQSNYIFLRSDLNTDDGRVYGFVHDFTDSETRIYWASADPEDLYDVELIAPLSEDYDPNRGSFCFSLCYNPADGYFYAINVMGELVRIYDDGTQEVVCFVGGDELVSYTLVTGMVWSPTANAFAWASCYGDNTSGMMLIPNGPSGAKTIDFFPTGPEFTTLITTDKVPSNPKKPARATIDSINFPEGALSGNVVFTLPTKLANGNDIPAGTMLDYTVYLDSRRHKSGKAEAGSQITIDYTVAELGYHIFGITTTYDMAKSFQADKKAWIGYDVPFAPANVNLTQKLVSWDAVGSTGVHGGYINPEDVTYIVCINNEEVGRTKETSFELDLDSEYLMAFTAYIYAEYEGSTGAAGQSNKIVTGRDFIVPMYLAPTQGEFDLMTVIDGNNDGFKWEYYDYRKCLQIKTKSKTEISDDYIFLPAVEITDLSHLLSFSLDAVIRDVAKDYVEYLEVVWATAPDDDHLGGYIIEEFVPEGNVYRDQWTYKEGLWNVEEPGVYYIGLHCTSPARQCGIYVKNMLLEQSPVTVDSPAIPVVKSAKPAAKGELNADVTVELPSKTWEGEDLPADMELTVHMIVNDEEIKATTIGHPGESVVVNVPTIQGDNTVKAYLTTGELRSPTSERFVIFTGQSIPAATENVKFKVEPDMMHATISWDPVTKADVPNGYIDPEEVSYTVYIARSADSEWREYRTNITETSMDFSVTEFERMDIYKFGVQTYNDEGVNEAIVRSGEDLMGKPYTLPFGEHLDGGNGVFNTLPWLTYNKHDGGYIYGAWAYGELYDIIIGAPIENSLAIIGYSLWKDDYGLLSMPRFSTKGVDNATLTIPTVYGPFMATMKVLAKKYGFGTDEYIELGEVDAYSEEFSRGVLTYQLPAELMDQDWVEIYFLAYFEYANTFMLMESIDVTADESGVSLLESAGTVTGGKNAIYVNGFEGENVTITSLDGKQFVNGVANSDRMAYPLEKGIYVVTAGTQRMKVVVK